MEIILLILKMKENNLLDKMKVKHLINIQRIIQNSNNRKLSNSFLLIQILHII